MREGVEPEYRYVKGQGWVVSCGRAETYRWELFEVTIEQREPTPDERYLSSNHDFDVFVPHFKASYNWSYQRYVGEPELGEIILKTGFKGLVKNKYVYTIKVVRV